MRDVFLALSSRMEAVTGEAVHVPPAGLPEVAAAPADLVAIAAIDPEAIDPQAASPGFLSPALRRDSDAAWSDAADVAQGAAAAVSAAPDQAATAPAEPEASDVSVSRTSAKTARAPDRIRVPPRHARRRRLFRGGRGFATRSRILLRRDIIFRSRYVIRTLPQPARLLCYAACAGPPALLRRA